MAVAEVKGGVDLGRIRVAIDPVLSAHGVLLVDLVWTTENRGWTLRVTIERLEERASASPDSRQGSDASGNVTLEDCAEVSRDISQVLDVEDLIAPRYSLEVSSPGLERPLKSRSDFARFGGKLAKVKLRQPAPDGQRVLRGPIDASSEDTIAIVVDGKRVEVPYATVTEANLVFELTTGEKIKTNGHRPTAGPRSTKAKR